jgi:hypothetical protein
MNRDRSAGIATGYALDDRGLIPGRSERFFSIASRPALRPTESPIQMIPEALPPGVKQAVSEAYRSPPSSVEDKNGGAIPPLPHMFSYHSA